MTHVFINSLLSDFDKDIILNRIKVGDSIIYIIGRPGYDELRRLDTEGIIHLGLRRYNEPLVSELPYISLSNNVKIIYSKTKSDEKLNLFNSNELESLCSVELPECNVHKITELTIDELNNILSRYDGSDAGFDFETAGNCKGFPDDEEFIPLGFSFANYKTGDYIDFVYYPETKDSESDKFEILRKFIKKNENYLWAYNVSFEMRCLYRMYHEFFYLQDTRSYCIADENRSNLKYSAQLYLGMLSWDEENEIIMRHWNHIFSLYNSYEEFVINKDNHPEILDGLDLDRVKHFWNSCWGCVPYDILGQYCCIDSFVDLPIKDKLKEIYSDECYKTILYNQYLGADLNMNAISIDTKIRDDIYKKYSNMIGNSALYINYYITYAKLLNIKFDHPEIESEVSEILSKCNDFDKYLINIGAHYLFRITDDTSLGVEFIKYTGFNEDSLKYLSSVRDELEWSINRVHEIGASKFCRAKKSNGLGWIGSLLRSCSSIMTYYSVNNDDITKNEKILDIYPFNPEELLNLSIVESKVPKEVFNQIKYFSSVEYKYDRDYHIFDYIYTENLINQYKEATKDRSIISDYDNKYDWLLKYKISSPKDRGEVIAPLLRSFRYELAILYAFNKFLVSKGIDIHDSKKEDFIRFSDKLMSIGIKGTYAEAYFNEKDPWFSMENYLIDESFGFYPLSVNWIKESVNHYNYIPAEISTCFLKMKLIAGLYAIYASANKSMSTYIEGAMKNSRNVVRLDESNRIAYTWRDTNDVVLKVSWSVNSVQTLRWSSGMHTLPPENDIRLAYKMKTGYIGTYFDISQAEPRTIAYKTKDPYLYRLYEDGKDAYKEMAKVFLQKQGKDPDDNGAVMRIRKIFKTMFLGAVYGRSPVGMAGDLGISEQEARDIYSMVFEQMTEIAKFKQEHLDYASENLRVKTLLGNKITIRYPERVYTTSVNYDIQGYTAITLVKGWYNAIMYARSIGIDLNPQVVVHDSITTEFPIKYLIHMDLIYRKYFRQFLKETEGPDYKYDLVILKDLLYHYEYSLDLDTKIVKMTIWDKYYDEFIEHFNQSYSYKIIKKELIVNGLWDRLEETYLYNARCHNLLIDPDYNRTSYYKLELQLDELPDITKHV